MKELLNDLTEVHGTQKRSTTQLTDLDGKTVIQEKAEILDRFTNYFDKLLNITGDVDHSVLDTTALRPNIASLDEKPEIKELLDAINVRCTCRTLKTWQGETHLQPVQTNFAHLGN